MYQYCHYCNTLDAWFGSYYTSGKCDKCFLKAKEDEKDAPFRRAHKLWKESFLMSHKMIAGQWQQQAYTEDLTYESLQSLCSIPQLERC